MRFHLTTNKYKNKEINGVPHIYLQDYGFAAAKPAEDFKIGERMKWNGGGTSKVVRVIKETASTIVFELEEQSPIYGDALHERKFLKSRWVAIG